MQLAVAMVLLGDEASFLDRRIIDLTRKVEQLPVGYISMKSIKGKMYPYLQSRSGEGKVVSRAIRKNENLQEIEALIEERKKLEAEIERCKRERDDIINVLEHAAKRIGMV